MKLALIAAFGLAAAAVTAPAHAADEAATTAAATPVPTLDMPIETLMADERAKVVLSANLPGIDQHPSYEDFKVMNLKTLAPFSGGLITAEVLTKIEAELAAIK
jgi:hypothetical protein